MTSTITILNLPNPLLEQISDFLPPRHLLAWLSAHTRFYRLSRQADFWKRQNEQRFRLDSKELSDFRLQAHMRTMSMVQWIPLQDQQEFRILAAMQADRDEDWEEEQHEATVENRVRIDLSMRPPTACEGHAAVYCPSINVVVVTPGFSRAPCLHVWNLNQSRWYALVLQKTDFCYGASWTILQTSSVTEAHILRFGGFAGGGYQEEQAIVRRLVVRCINDSMEARWEPISTVGPTPPRLPRAYHTATLLNQETLFVFGGMRQGHSTNSSYLLNLTTMTWYDGPSSNSDPTLFPSARHGHSAIYDQIRRRVLVFGGANGGDLLRSGCDNAQVWQFDVTPSDTFGATMVHPEPRLLVDGFATNRGHPANRLRPTESLCLGRCHAAHQVGDDKVIFLFGSAHPSTNGVLAFNLAHDVFARPDVKIMRPNPRFTFASAFIPHLGYIFSQGGFDPALGEVDDPVLLDLAPLLHREAMHHFNVKHPYPSLPNVLDSDVARAVLRPGQPEPTRIMMLADAAKRLTHLRIDELPDGLRNVVEQFMEEPWADLIPDDLVRNYRAWEAT